MSLAAFHVQGRQLNLLSKDFNRSEVAASQFLINGWVRSRRGAEQLSQLPLCSHGEARLWGLCELPWYLP